MYYEIPKPICLFFPASIEKPSVVKEVIFSLIENSANTAKDYKIIMIQR